VDGEVAGVVLPLGPRVCDSAQHQGSWFRGKHLHWRRGGGDGEVVSRVMATAGAKAMAMVVWTMKLRARRRRGREVALVGTNDAAKKRARGAWWGPWHLAKWRRRGHLEAELWRGGHGDFWKSGGGDEGVIHDAELE
jgi:hypothetical protein